MFNLRHIIHLNPMKHEVHLNNISQISFYLKENTARLHYKN
jgi:hypothetical protein